MRVLVAGATGAIGKPLIRRLLDTGHETYGITHTAERAQVLAATGARPLPLDVFDHKAVVAALQHVRPDVVIDMLTSLPKEYTADAMRAAAEVDARLRVAGGGNLQAAAEACGVHRYVVQSSAFWYSPGEGLAEESAPFAYSATPGIAAGTRLYAEIEKRVLQSTQLEGVAMRFGFFYGPGTWYHVDGDMGKRVANGQFPIVGAGEGIWSFIHIDDAAQAAATGVYCNPGAYNIVNNRPAMMKEWLPGFARHLNAPYPLSISESDGAKRLGPDLVYYATKLRGASNAKAKREWNFEPRTFEWLL